MRCKQKSESPIRAVAPRFGRYSITLFTTHTQGQPARRKRNPYLADNFAPVPDETAAPCTLLEGTLPPALDGVFARIGPNPALPPTGDYHWFDGDGMVHAVRIKGGQPTYANRYVQTARLQAERAAGHALYAKFGDYRGAWALGHMVLQGLRRVAGLLPAKRGGVGGGTANTALVFHARCAWRAMGWCRRRGACWRAK
jgi:carotenoid 9,10(9',10')-cleavage dioxygenase 1